MTRESSLPCCLQAVRAGALLCLLWTFSQTLRAETNPAPRPSAAAPAVAPRDGQHDFDFSSGTWHTHIVRTLDPFNDKSSRIEIEGTVSNRRVWGGHAWLEEIEADGPNGHWEGLNLFLYNPKTRQWSQSFANSKTGTLEAPFIGEFKNGRGELFCQDTFNGKPILVRAVWSNVSADAHRYEEFFSDDGGKTWKLSFVANKTRMPANEVRRVPE